MVTGRLAATAEYLVAARLNVGDMASRHHEGFFSRFCDVATELGFAPKAVQLQWSTLVKIAVMHQVNPDQITPAQLGAGRQALIEASLRHARGEAQRAAAVVTKDVFGIEATLFHLGITDDPPPSRAATRRRNARSNGQESLHSWRALCSAIWTRSRCRCVRRRWWASRRCSGSSPASSAIRLPR